MSETESMINPSSMIDVDLARVHFDFATVRETCAITLYNGEDDLLDNMLHQGWTVTGITTLI